MNVGEVRIAEDSDFALLKVTPQFELSSPIRHSYLHHSPFIIHQPFIHIINKMILFLRYY